MASSSRAPPPALSRLRAGDAGPGQGQARLCHRGQLRGPEFWGSLLCTGQQVQRGSPAVLAWWGPCFTVSREGDRGGLLRERRKGRVIFIAAPIAWLWLPLGPPALSWPRAGRSGDRLGASVLSKQTPRLLCSRGHGTPRVSGGAIPLSELRASGPRTSADGLSCRGARGGGTDLGRRVRAGSCPWGVTSAPSDDVSLLWVPLGPMEAADLGHLRWGWRCLRD